MAVKSRFRLLHGTHVDKGVVFKAGDQIEDESDLVARFPGKFVKEAVFVERDAVKAVPVVAPSAPPKAAPVEAEAPAEVEDETPDETDGEEEAEVAKTDVTGDFPEASGKNVTIWTDDDGGYTVVKGKATLFTGNTPRQVKKFLKTLE